MKIAQKFLFCALVFIFFVTFCAAQSKADIEVTVQNASDIARGGETFAYTITVKNIGAAKATDVILLQTGSRGEISAAPSRGECELATDSWQIPRPFRCRFGDLEPDEAVTVNFSIKIPDFGGEPEQPDDSLARSLNTLFEAIRSQSSENDQLELLRETLASISVYPEESEENTKNNSAEVKAELLPSRNRPPRVEIISPQRNAVITRRVDQPLQVTLNVKASDPDGKIEKVIVNDPAFSPKVIIEDDQYKFAYRGKTYTGKELEEYFKTSPPIETLATQTGSDTYTYVLKNLPYGQNRIFVKALDDGGRITSAMVDLQVEGDAQVKIVSPKQEQIFTPDSTIKIETLSTINDPALSNLRINGTGNDSYPREVTDIPLLQLTSKVGNVYKNQYVLKNVPAGEYLLEAILFDDSTPTNRSEAVKIVVAERRVIKISSLKNGQEFEEGKPVRVLVEALDRKGELVPDELELLIDGKSNGYISNAWKDDFNQPQQKIFDQTAGKTITSLSKGAHTFQIVAKYRLGFEKIKIGESEIVTIKIK